MMKNKVIAMREKTAVVSKETEEIATNLTKTQNLIKEIAKKTDDIQFQVLDNGKVKVSASKRSVAPGMLGVSQPFSVIVNNDKLEEVLSAMTDNIKPENRNLFALFVDKDIVKFFKKNNYILDQVGIKAKPIENNNIEVLFEKSTFIWSNEEAFGRLGEYCDLARATDDIKPGFYRTEDGHSFTKEEKLQAVKAQDDCWEKLVTDMIAKTDKAATAVSNIGSKIK